MFKTDKMRNYHFAGPAGGKACRADLFFLQGKRKERRKRQAIFALLAFMLLCIGLWPMTVPAAEVPAPAGKLTVNDGADLLTDAEEAQLIEKYSGITDYMEAAFVSTDNKINSASAYAESYAIANYGNDPAVIFLIDMYGREIYIYANGSALKTISRADARAITDNIYKSASRGEYYECADSAFSQIYAKCQGEKLARPVKHITNAMIAVLVGILLNYFITVNSRRPAVERRTQGTVKASVTRQMADMPGISLAVPIILSSVKHYKSGGSGGSGGGGGGGGGHSGGGGGHSF